MSIIRAGSQTVIKLFSATERIVEVVDNIAHMGTNISGAGVEVSEIWGDDIKATSLITAEERRLNREDSLNQLRARIAAGIPAEPMEGEATQ